MVANCGGRDKVIVIINQNGEDPPIVQQQQQDKHRGHGQSRLVLQKVAFELHPKVRNHGEGPY